MISIFKNGKKFNKINGINLLFRANRESRNHKEDTRNESTSFGNCLMANGFYDYPISRARTAGGQEVKNRNTLKNLLNVT
jgi:hypothetical protein